MITRVFFTTEVDIQCDTSGFLCVVAINIAYEPIKFSTSFSKKFLTDSFYNNLATAFFFPGTKNMFY